MTWLFLSLLLSAQAPAVTGRVLDATGLPLPGAVISVKDGDVLAVTGADGTFTLPASSAGSTVIVALPGFVSREIRMNPSAPGRLDISLALAPMASAVSVRAPAAAATSETRLPITPLDVVRTPGTQADLMRALSLLPGVSQVDEGAGLFVRGGDVSEVLVLLDGVIVSHPYRYESPSGGFRGAVDPFMTQGASFTTGGFSADFGNVLSAVVDLQSLGRPRDRQVNITAGLAGVSVSGAAPLGSVFGVRAAANRSTPGVLFAVNPSPQEFDRLPGGWDVSASAHAQSPQLGAVKILSLTQRDHVGVSLEKDAFVGFLHSSTSHQLTLARWERAVSGRWVVVASAGADAYAKGTDVGVFDVDERETHRSARVVMTGMTGTWGIRAGADIDAAGTRLTGRVPASGGDFGGVRGTTVFDVKHDATQAGAFAVMSRAAGRFIPELGWRIDRLEQTKQGTAAWVADPRAAVRVEFGKARSLRLAWGRYHQEPSPSYFDNIRGAESLRPMVATHYIVGLDLGTPASSWFARAEAFVKRYDDLPVEDARYGFTSEGYGQARGLDVYLRRIWPRFDLRISGSLLDADRRWTSSDQRDRYPLPDGAWTPDFSIPWSATMVGNVSLSHGFSVAATWRAAAGKPFTPVTGAIAQPEGYSPVFATINSERLPHYQRLNVALTRLMPLGASTAGVFFASVDNVLGRRNFFEYAYSIDYSTRRPVLSGAPRTFYIGFSLTR